jgi:transposase
LPIVADHYRFVVGGDTHAASHSYAIIACPSGRLIAESTFPTSSAGLTRAVAWITRHTPGGAAGVLVTVEGTGSYGAVLADRLGNAGYRVVEAPTPSAKRLRGNGKTDALDAITAARSTMVTDVNRLCDRRRGQIRTALNVLSVAREQLNADRLRCINALTALVRAHDLGVDARRALTKTQITIIAGWRRRDEPIGLAAARAEAIRLARRIGELDDELSANRAQLDAITTEHAPQLLGLHGVGAVTAAVILTVWSHPGRIRSEAALAKIAGTCPIPASSGNTIRHRLNRGGDRRLNKAISTIVLTRMRTDAATRVYIGRRTAEGRSKKEITRCLRRYVTRQIHRTLTSAKPLDTT